STYSDCCSSICSGGHCQASSFCAPAGSACMGSTNASCCSPSTCQSLTCVMPAPTCRADNAACTDYTQCCSMICGLGVCQGATYCATRGNGCAGATNASCCTGQGTCQYNGSGGVCQ